MNISLIATIIGLREAIEAILIIAIFLAYLDKTNNQQYKKTVWTGVITALTSSIIVGGLVYLLFGELNERFEQLFEGTIMIFTAVLLTGVILWMLGSGSSVKQDLENRIEDVLDDKKSHGLLFLSFIVVFREGVETVLFLTGFSYSQGLFSVLSGMVLGISIALVLGIGFVRGSEVLSLKTFFNITSVLLILFAAGLFSYGIHEFQEAGLFGASSMFWNRELIDLSGVLDDKNDFLGIMLRSLFGYQDKPSLLEIVSYLVYLLVIGVLYVIKKKHGLSVSDKKNEEIGEKVVS